MSEKKEKSSIKGIMLFALIGAGIGLLFNGFFRVFTVSGESMENTYFEGDNLLLKRNHGDSYDYGDVVVFSLTAEDKKHTVLIKRVIAKGGDTLDIDFDSGEVRRNGELLDEPYIKELTHLDEEGFTYPVTIPDGCYFCMGDNRNASGDSRDRSIGFIPEEDIFGKVIWAFPKWL